MMRGLAGFVLAIAVAAAAAAAQQAKLGMKDPNAPIEVSAQNVVADANAKTVTYTGDVIIRQGDVRIRANMVRVNAVDGKADRATAQGAVVVDAPAGSATGDDGVYDITPRIVILTGHVVLIKEKNVMRGTRLTVNLVTGVAKLDGSQDKGGRVQGLFTPKTQSDEKP
jgi:lipopolysaccharide export system protein LptA